MHFSAGCLSSQESSNELHLQLARKEWAYSVVLGRSPGGNRPLGRSGVKDNILTLNLLAPTTVGARINP